MASKRETVVAGVTAMIAAALPNASVDRNATKPAQAAPGGNVFVRDGDPGEPEVDLSPLAYNYSHKIPLEIAGYKDGNKTKEQVVDEMMVKIGQQIAADPTLGGLVEWMEAEAPTFADLETTGSSGGIWADAAVIVQYATSNPLT